MVCICNFVVGWIIIDINWTRSIMVWRRLESQIIIAVLAIIVCGSQISPLSKLKWVHFGACSLLQLPTCQKIILTCTRTLLQIFLSLTVVFKTAYDLSLIRIVKYAHLTDFATAGLVAVRVVVFKLAWTRMSCRLHINNIMVLQLVATDLTVWLLFGCSFLAADAFGSWAALLILILTRLHIRLQTIVMCHNLWIIVWFGVHMNIWTLFSAWNIWLDNHLLIWTFRCHDSLTRFTSVMICLIWTEATLSWVAWFRRSRRCLLNIDFQILNHS